MGRRRSRSQGSGYRWTWIVVGIALLVVVAPIGPGINTQSEAFSSMSSDRGTSANVANDSGGLFGLDVASSVAAGTTSRLVTVTNNVGQTIDVTVDLNGATGTLSNNQGTLRPGESLVVSTDIACDPETDTVSFTVEGAAGDRFSGNTARSTSIDTSDCIESVGQIDGKSAAGGDNGKGDVTLQNTGSTSLTIVAIKFTDTNSTATKISNPGEITSNRSLEYSDGAFSFGTKVDMTANQTLALGEGVKISVDKFRNPGGSGSPNADMSGKYVEFIVYLSNGDEVTVKVTFPT
jgi:hypothetical protein